MTRSLDYICMQPTREGQASHAHVHEIVAGLRRRCWQVHLVEPPLPTPGRWDGLRRAFGALTAQAAYWARARFRPAKVVYIRSHFLTFPSALLARLLRATVIQELNGPIDDGYDAWPALRRAHRLIGFTMRAQLRWADAVIVVTPGLVGYVEDLTGRRGGIAVIGNGADDTRFIPLDAPDPPEHPYVVFVGALASWQGIAVVLDAVQGAAWPPGVGLVIAGDGREGERVREVAARDPRVRWLGSIPYRDVPAVIAGSIAALVPMTDEARSRTGLSPLKLFEAMACGVPVIASDLPGLGDLVRAHDCGILVPPGDADAVARAVADLVADPADARARGGRGRVAVVTSYSWDVRAGETDALLQTVRKGRRSRRRSRGRRS
jgi:glycosyltransferase involved in cell wall biosynthesis